MKLKSGNARKKLNVKEEAEEILLTSAVKEDRLLVQVLKANSSSKTFKRLRWSVCRITFFYALNFSLTLFLFNYCSYFTPRLTLTSSLITNAYDDPPYQLR